MSKDLSYLLRPMEERDIEDVMSAEIEAFGDTLGRDFLLSELKINPFAVYVVLVVNEEIAGYVGLNVSDNIIINNLLVIKKYQGMGFGNLIMDFIIEVCKSSKVSSLSLEVRKSNIIAINLYEKQYKEGQSDAANKYAIIQNSTDRELVEFIEKNDMYAFLGTSVSLSSTVTMKYPNSVILITSRQSSPKTERVMTS